MGTTDEGPTILVDVLCDHGDEVHGVRNMTGERVRGKIVKVCVHTYCGGEVGMCEARQHLRQVGTKSRMTCQGCLDVLRSVLGDKADMVLGPPEEKPKPRKRRKPPRKKRRRR